MAIEYEFTREDRLRQLGGVAAHSRKCADLIAPHDPWQRDRFEDVADEAERLLTAGFTSDELRVLGGAYPESPYWLNRRDIDYNAPRQPWQEEFAESFWSGAQLAGDLRARAVWRD